MLYAIVTIRELIEALENFHRLYARERVALLGTA